MDTRQLECFVAVAEELHLGRAAARLHMTQPPLTRRITRLEKDIGVLLFKRSRRGMELTEPGRILLTRAYQILSLTEHAVERAQRGAAGQVGNLVVGYSGSTIFDAVPRILHGFITARPEVELTLERAAKNAQADAIRAGRMHVGFSRLYREEPGLEVRIIRREPLFVAAPAKHPLAGSSQLHVADLRDAQLVLFPAAPRPSFADEISQLCRSAGFVVHAVREAEDAITAVAFVAASGYCTVVPRSVTRFVLPGIKFVPLTDAPEQEMSCIYRSGTPEPLLAAFLRHLDSIVVG
jgi:DNA-binding transcriptional LysR family regulator